MFLASVTCIHKSLFCRDDFSRVRLCDCEVRQKQLWVMIMIVEALSRDEPQSNHCH